MNAVLKPAALTPTMEACLAFMRGEPDRSIHRHRGGLWSRYVFTFQYAWTTATVRALVLRGHAYWSAERSGATFSGFPVRATLEP